MAFLNLFFALAVVGLGTMVAYLVRRDLRRARDSAIFRQEAGTQILALQFALQSALLGAHEREVGQEMRRQSRISSTDLSQHRLS